MPMNHTTVLRSIAAAVLLTCAAAHAQQRVMLPEKDPAFYVRKATWQETMYASRVALMRQEAAAARKLAAEQAAQPEKFRFTLADVKTARSQAPPRIRVKIAGLEKVCIRAEHAGDEKGRRGEVYLFDPKLIDSKGKERPLVSHNWLLRRSGTQWIGHRREEHKVAGRTFPEAITLGYETKRGVEGTFNLVDEESRRRKNVEERKFEWLEMWVGFRDDRSREGDVAHVVVSKRSAYAAQEQAVLDRQVLSALIERDFTGEIEKWQQRLENRHGIWREDWPVDDVSVLARRYAGKVAEGDRAKANELAKTARTPDDLAAVQAVFYLGAVRDRVDLADRTLAFVERSAPRPELAGELAKIKREVEQFAARPRPDGNALLRRVSALRRRIILSHPALDFEKLLINKRPPTGYSHMCDQYLGRHSGVGAGLVVLENWKDKPKATVLLAGKLPEGSTLHPDLSFDAKRVIFSFCDHTEKNRSLRRFFVYEATLDGKRVRQLTGTRGDRLRTWCDRRTVLVEDFDPCYLPGGGFAFVSTRSQSYGRCHGGRYTPVYMLHRADAGPGAPGNIRQLSFAEANEWDPAVMPDGRIVYTRWDYINRHDVRYQSLWTIRPDGTGTAHYYGNYSSSPCMIAEAHPIPGTSKVVATAMAHHSYTTGSTITLDVTKGEDGWDPIGRVTPEIRFPEANDNGRGPFEDGAYCNPYPLNEVMYLAAYTPDKQAWQGSVQAKNAYGIYLVDTLGGRELIYRDPEISCFSPTPVRPRPRPPVPPSMASGDRDVRTGVFYVQDVHRSTQPLPPGSIKYLRINEIFGQPTPSHPHRSRANNEIVKRILGTVPVSRDGSAAFRVPAGIPMQIQALDAERMAVMTMRTVVYVQAGERAGCVGCHESRMSSPLAAAKIRDMTIRDLTPPDGPAYRGGFSFARTVQPVLDRYCIRCHGLDKTEGKLNLLGTPENGFSTAYCSLMDRRGLVALAQRNGETGVSKPKDYFAHAGKLAGLITTKYAAKSGLDRRGLQCIINWLDLNAQFYGDYSRNRLEDRRIAGKGEKALREHLTRVFGDKLAQQPLAALINVTMPTESRILKAPLAVQAGGWGQIAKGAWPSTDDPGYKKMLDLVQACIEPLARHDVQGTCGAGRRGCRCGSCWVREAEDRHLNPPEAKVSKGGE